MVTLSLPLSLTFFPFFKRNFYSKQRSICNYSLCVKAPRRTTYINHSPGSMERSLLDSRINLRLIEPERSRGDSSCVTISSWLSASILAFESSSIAVFTSRAVQCVVAARGSARISVEISEACCGTSFWSLISQVVLHSVM